MFLLKIWRNVFLKNVVSYLHLGYLNDLSLYCFCTCKLNWLAHESACQHNVLSPPIINNKHDFLSLWATADALYNRGEDSYKPCCIQSLPAFKPASVERVNMVRKIWSWTFCIENIQYMVYKMLAFEFTAASQEGNKEKACRQFCIFQASIRLYVHLEGNFSKPWAHIIRTVWHDKGTVGQEEEKVVFPVRDVSYLEKVLLFTLTVFCALIQTECKVKQKFHNNINYKPQFL